MAGRKGTKRFFAANIPLTISLMRRQSFAVPAVPLLCSAGSLRGGKLAIAMAKRLLDGHYADIVLAGGVDVFSKVAFAGFQRLLSLAPDVCRPFDKERRGLVLGEGCGVVVWRGKRSGWEDGSTGMCWGPVWPPMLII